MKVNKIVSIILAAVMLVTLFTACGKASEPGKNSEAAKTGISEDKGINVEGVPIVKEKITLKFVAPRASYFVKSYGEMDAIKDLEQKTNIHIEWEEIAESAWDEKVKLYMASSVLPDAFYGRGNDNSLVYIYGKQGILIPLEGLIDKYTSNMKKYLSEKKTLKSIIPYPDGHIYGIPMVNEQNFLRIGESIYVNKEWMNKLSINEPTTTEEFYQMLKAFRDKDANGNGKKDEICLSLTIGNDANGYNNFKQLGSLFGAFGQPENGTHISVVNGKVQYNPITEGYKEALKYFNILFKEGLFDPESFTQDQNQVKSKASAKEGIGATVNYWQTNFADAASTSRYGWIKPLKGPKGIQLWNVPAFANLSTNRFLITKSNKYPEATIRWADYQLDNGDQTLSIRFGPEGKGWQRNPDGTWKNLSTSIKDESQFCPSSQSLFWLFDDLNQKMDISNLPISADRKKGAVEYLKASPEEVWVEQLSFDETDSTNLIALKTELNKYVDNMLAKFIIEGMDDAKWNEYVNKIKALKSDELVKIYQKRYDAYMKSK